MNRSIPVSLNTASLPCRRFARSHSAAAAAIGLLSILVLPCSAALQSDAKGSPAPQPATGQNTKTNPRKRKAGKQSVRQAASGKAVLRQVPVMAQKTVTVGTGSNTFALTQRSVPMPIIKAAAVPIITYFTQDTKDWIRAGDVVYVTMQGTAGGQATLSVAGIGARITMKETSPGRYVGRWMTPAAKPLALAAAAVTGELRVNGANAVPLQTSRPLAIDTTLPRIENFAPATSQTVDTATPTISADFADTGSGIDASSARLIVNGRDLTGEANVTTERIVYKPIVPLSGGDQLIQLIVSDRAGNKYQTSWHFTVTSK